MPPTSRWVERLSRIGILAKALIYLIIGLLATGVAFNLGGALTGSRDVLHLLVTQPLGRVILGLLALGLAAYTFWLFVQAFVDPDRKGAGFRGLVDRAGEIITGIAHATLTVEAARLALGLPGFMRPDGTERWVAGLLAQPHGGWVAGLAGAIVVIIGASQVWRALRGDVRREWRLRELDPHRDRWRLGIGRFGLAARGLVLAIAGGLVLRAAQAYDPQAAGGLGDVLQTIREQPGSDWLLGGVALGLVAYGLFALIEARFRFIPTA